jgi:hypothetical protein
MRFYGTPRAAGAWGLVSVVLLFAGAAMVSLPTAALSGDRIAAFYAAHGQLIVIQQVVGVVALGAFALFALSLRPNRWLRPTLVAFIAVELATNIVPLVIVFGAGSSDAAHTWTFVEDIADALFSIAIALFVAAATLGEPLWVRILGYAVAALNVLRGVGDPLGFTALDAVAPLAFVVFMVVFSAKLLVRPHSSAT